MGVDSGFLHAVQVLEREQLNNSNSFLSYSVKKVVPPTCLWSLLDIPCQLSRPQLGDGDVFII